MAYFVIDDFRIGVDRRRLPQNSLPASLYTLINAHITPGGDIEKRKCFSDLYDATGTFGLAALGSEVYVFGTAARPGGLDADVNYQQLTGTAKTIAKMVDWDVYDGKLYTVFEMTDGTVQHFYDGTLVSGTSGRYIKTYKSKVYAVEAGNVHFSAIGDPTDWAGVGSGFINLAAEDSDAANLLGLESYYNSLAFFSDESVQRWDLASDPTENQQLQTLRGTGSIAPLSPYQYASGDVLYLDNTGIRSLKARDSSNSAVLSDVGSPVDKLVRDRLLVGDVDLNEVFSLHDPTSGRFWLVMKDTVFVLSVFNKAEIAAWSVYEPGFNAVCGTLAGDRVFLRGDDDKLYAYGGADGETFLSCPVTVITPFLDFGKPASFKQFDGIDLSSNAEWQVWAAFDPTQPDVYDYLGTYSGATFPRMAMALRGESTHVRLKLTTSAESEAVLAQVALHYRELEGAA